MERKIATRNKREHRFGTKIRTIQWSSFASFDCWKRRGQNNQHSSALTNPLRSDLAEICQQQTPATSHPPCSVSLPSSSSVSLRFHPQPPTHKTLITASTAPSPSTPKNGSAVISSEIARPSTRNSCRAAATTTVARRRAAATPRKMIASKCR